MLANVESALPRILCCPNRLRVTCQPLKKKREFGMFAEHPLQHGAIAYRPFLNGDLEFGEPCGIDGECIEFRVEHATPLTTMCMPFFKSKIFSALPEMSCLCYPTSSRLPLVRPSAFLRQYGHAEGS